MRLFPAEIPALLLLFIISVAPLSHAQTWTAESKAGPMNYDPAQEVTISGTVAEVLLASGPGMLAGAHLLLTTLAGQVDVSLGTFGLRGKGALSVAPGRQIEITGVMKRFKSSPVFLARSVTTDGVVHAIRNEHGIPVTPQARTRTNQESTNEGKR